MLEKVEEAVGGPEMKPLHDRLKKMQVLLLRVPAGLYRRPRIDVRGKGLLLQQCLPLCRTWAIVTIPFFAHDTLRMLADESCGQGERARGQERPAGEPHGGAGGT